MSLNAAEHFAVDLLDLLGGMIAEPLTKGGRPDFDAIDLIEPQLSTGESRILRQALDAWRGKEGSLIADIGRLDRDTAAKVVEAFNRAVSLQGWRG